MIAKEQGYKGLSLSSSKLKNKIIKPKVQDGKMLLDRNNKLHRCIHEDEEN
ncbi:hypothetical protein ACKA0G_28990 [Priestia megaterium]|uniref:hypothetical protein n=1 Tax=Priestia megaterium TaxID=1404 RepID=UPI0038A91B10